jgi:Tol biopolymer transport system component
MDNRTMKIIGLTALAFFSFLLPAAESVRFPFPSRIAFNSDFSGNHEIYLLSENRLTRLTNHPAKDEYPVASHSGDKITFHSDRNGNFDIFVLDLQTGQTIQITTDPKNEVTPSWSSDDSTIYYNLETGRNGWISMKVGLKSKKTEPLFPDPPFSSTIVPFQNRRGDEFFFTGKVFLGWVVAKYEAAGGTYSRLAETGSCRPRISPDDRKIAYVSHRDDHIGDVFIMNTDGSGKTNLTPGRVNFYDYYPCFSPDGQWIVFSSSPKSLGKTGYQLYTIELKTGKIRKIFSSSGNNVFPNWFH